MKKCQHIVGIMHNYEDTDLITLHELNEQIRSDEFMLHHPECCTELSPIETFYTREEYCSDENNTSFRKFKYCPKCGEEINWENIMKGVNE